MLGLPYIFEAIMAIDPGKSYPIPLTRSQFSNGYHTLDMFILGPTSY